MRATHLALTFLITLGVSGAAFAQYPFPPQRFPGAGYSTGQQGYDAGYREGLERGARDARDRRGYDPGRHGAYREASDGYHSSYGNRDQYRASFRRGFDVGYREGYSRWGGPRGRTDDRSGWGGWDRDSRYGYGGRGYQSPAFQNGLNDGYRQGLDAARDRDRYDPTGEKWFRRADRGYDRRFGPREYYQRDYREGFRQGYDRAYREAGGRWR